jgi:hypothetical protein
VLDDEGDATNGSATGDDAGTVGRPQPDSAPDPVGSSTTSGAPTSSDVTGFPPPATSSDTGSWGSTSAACDPGETLDCAGTIYACTNGEDDDGDGLVDLDDPECLGPCDDSESAFENLGPHGFTECRRDCAFDGNDGLGDDGCLSNLRCDPLDPGSVVGCEYQPGAPCDSPLGEACLPYCIPFTPNGCDCWGCCTIEVDGQPRNIQVTFHPDCSASNLDACPECTQLMDVCGNPCDVDGCEICFGETDKPPDCFAAACPDADPCTSHCDCEPGGYCMQGCCHPPPG